MLNGSSAIRHSAFSILQHRQASLDDAEPVAQLLLADRQRRIGEERVPADKRVEPFLAEELSESLHWFRGTVEWRQRFHGRSILHQLHDPEESDRARGADDRVARRETVHQSFHDHAHTSSVLNQTVFFGYL